MDTADSRAGESLAQEQEPMMTRFDEQDWLRRIQAATSSEQVTELIMTLPLPQPLFESAEAVVFTPRQRDEIQKAAIAMAQEKQWDDLPWERAWSGAFPQPPSAAEILRMEELLRNDAREILAGSPLDTIDCYQRMIWLESCPSLHPHHKETL